METKYFICIRPRTDGGHTLHKEDCPFLPEPGNRIFLGIFKSTRGAMKEGRKYFRFPAKCIFCSREGPAHDKMLFFHGQKYDQHLVSYRKVKVTRENAFLCCSN
jgi:hypothetical protein